MSRLGLRPLAVLVVLALPAQAELPRPLTHTVSDFAEVLQEADEIEISDRLSRLRQDPGSEVAVVTLRSPAAYGGPEPLAAFAKALFNAWGIGDARRNDGVLVLLAMDERELRIALGAGYPPVWDGRAQRVIEALMLPKLKAGDTAGAILAGLQGIEDHILRPYHAGARVLGTEGMPEAPSDFGGLDFALFAAVILGAGGLIGWQNRHRLGDRLAGYRPCPSCGRPGVRVETLPAGLSGAQIVRRHCPNCGWHSDRSQSAEASHRSDDNDGGGGFGGGHSSGGGAGGRW